MVFEISFFILASILLVLIIIGVYVDIKIKEIPDTINIIIALSALIFRFVFSFKFGFWYFLEGVLGGIVLFTLGYGLYRLSQWGGGDVKLIGALGCFTGLGIWEQVLNFPTGLIFLLMLIISTGIYGFVTLTYYSLRKTKRKYFLFTFILAGIAVGIAFSFKDLYVFMASIVLLILSLILFTIEIAKIKNLFYKNIKLINLREGDWVVDEIKIRNKIFYQPKYDGIDKEQINKIRKEIKRNNLLDLKTTIKEGIPLAPAFLIAYLIYIFMVFV